MIYARTIYQMVGNKSFMNQLKQKFPNILHNKLFLLTKYSLRLPIARFFRFFRWFEVRNLPITFLEICLISSIFKRKFCLFLIVIFNVADIILDLSFGCYVHGRNACIYRCPTSRSFLLGFLFNRTLYLAVITCGKM